jgi:hypothetical protein
MTIDDLLEFGINPLARRKSIMTIIEAIKGPNATNDNIPHHLTVPQQPATATPITTHQPETPKADILLHRASDSCDPNAAKDSEQQENKQLTVTLRQYDKKRLSLFLSLLS